MTIVVEGVETVEQVNFLAECCRAPQIKGFYFSKPMKAAELSAWCKKYTTFAEI
jgi:EAL domain-containing protein (putative c-di-GMP-specific phosphodiesterase class I)